MLAFVFWRSLFSIDEQMCDANLTLSVIAA